MRSPTDINWDLFHSEISSQYPISLLEFGQEEFSFKSYSNKIPFE